MSERAIRPKERDGVIQALRAGVVPRLGLQHVQVGRAAEVEQVIRDVERIADGGSAFRVVIGEYGSGKTFFLTLSRSVAVHRRVVTVHADLSPDRRIHATSGQARGLYAELMRNMATLTKQEGGALASVVERFVGEAQKQARACGTEVTDAIAGMLAPVRDMVSGHDFATVVQRYWTASENGDEAGKAAALRWLRGEYALKTEAREALGVRTIIDDATVYDYLKVMGRFVTLAGYDGLLIVIDEMVNLFRLANLQARTSNYEQMLRMLNDTLQGSAGSMGFYFGGTPESLLDTRRGLASYEALRTRLAENAFAKDGLVDLSGPVIRLQALAPEELFVLLRNLRHVFAGGDPSRHAVPDEALEAFMVHCNAKIGAAYFRTPRNTIKAFLDLLAVLEQNPGADWRSLVGSVEVAPDAQPAGGDINEDAPATVAGPSGRAGDDELESFVL